MPLIRIRNSYTGMYYSIPLKHATCLRMHILDIYFTKDFSATYQQPELCLRTSSEAVARKGWAKSGSSHSKMGCALKKGSSLWKEREMPWDYPQNSSKTIKTYKALHAKKHMLIKGQILIAKPLIQITLKLP